MFDMQTEITDKKRRKNRIRKGEESQMPMRQVTSGGGPGGILPQSLCFVDF
jgi:hypothetical protein